MKTVTRITQGAHDYQANHVGNFSLVLGGPLFQLFRRFHLAGGGLELLRRRVVDDTEVQAHEVGNIAADV